MAIDPKDSVLVDGSKLRADRIKLHLSQEAVAGNSNHTFSLSTYRRAENGVRISRDSLIAIASFFHKEADHYVATNIDGINIESIPRVGGRWEAFYVEDDINEDPYIVKEDVIVKQDREKITGEYICTTYDRPDNFVLEGRIINNILCGRYYAPGRRTTSGIGLFQLAFSRNNEWLDGFCTWMDYDREKIECSRNVWIRKDAHFKTKLLNDVEAIMKEEKSLFRIRKL